MTVLIAMVLFFWYRNRQMDRARYRHFKKCVKMAAISENNKNGENGARSMTATRTLVVVADHDDKYPVDEVIKYLRKPVLPSSRPTPTKEQGGAAWAGAAAAAVGAAAVDSVASTARTTSSDRLAVELVVLPDAEHGDVIINPEHTKMVFHKVESLLDAL